MKRKRMEQYIVVTDQHLFIADSLKEVIKQTGMMLEEREFKRIDGNYIVQMNDSSIDFVIDKQRMSNIPWQHLIKKDMTINYLLYGVLAILLIILLRG